MAQALDYGEELFATGVVLQELLQGFNGPKAGAAIVERFAAIPLISPTRDDHIEAAQLRNQCRRAGFQVGTIDALLAQLCVSRGLVMLSGDQDFARIANETGLKVWK